MPFIQLPHTFKQQEKYLFLQQKMSSQMHSWLLDRDSLTKRIIEHCSSQKNKFRVEVLKQGKNLPNVSDMLALGMNTRQWVYTREVLLYCGNTPVVYAKTVIPLQTLTGEQRKLAFLGKRPLGAYLFSQPNLLRTPIEIAQCWHQNQQLWARRSAFYLENKPLLVYEVFLSGLGN